MIEIVFYISLILIFYVYAGYPLAALALSRLHNREVLKADIEPTVTVLISAYNEEESIGATIANKLALDYPTEKLDILVISDGSTDHTEAIVSGFADRRVRLLRRPAPRARR